MRVTKTPLDGLITRCLLLFVLFWLLDGVDFKKHAGVISYFQREYVKTKIFDVKYSKYLSQAFQIRNNTDYADFFVVSEGEAEEQYERAQDFYKAIAHYLTERNTES